MTENCFVCGFQAEIHTCECVLNNLRSYTVGNNTDFLCYACLNPNEDYDDLFHARAWKYLCEKCFKTEMKILQVQEKLTENQK